MKTQRQCSQCKSFKVESNKDAWKSVLLGGIATSWIFGIGLIGVFFAPFVWLGNKWTKELIVCKQCGYKYNP